ncbi:MAG: M48 family metallopeptidase [Rubrivivax sp.]|nr:M48 family metallopeptidase [Rubrivivax sp.]
MPLPPGSHDARSQQLSLFDEAPAAALAAPAAPAAQPASPLSCKPVLQQSPPAAAPAAPPARPVAALPPDGFRHPNAQREIVLGPHRVAYELRRARRRSIGFVVGAEGLSVSAPRWVGLGEVEAALREKKDWILRKLQEQRERASRLQAARVDWREGVTLPFLGETVIVVLDPRTTGAVLHSGSPGNTTLPGVTRLTLHLGLPQTAAPEQIRDAVQSWLQRQAKRVFEERCQLFARRLNVRMTRLALSSAATRWGSASADGSIRLNWRLVHFGLPVIDYVVTHELAHLREMNHSPAFWDVVRSALPDYEAARGVLRHEVLPVLE